jgi:hypothetical protein
MYVNICGLHVCLECMFIWYPYISMKCVFVHVFLCACLSCVCVCMYLWPLWVYDMCLYDLVCECVCLYEVYVCVLKCVCIIVCVHVWYVCLGFLCLQGWSVCLCNCLGVYALSNVVFPVTIPTDNMWKSIQGHPIVPLELLFCFGANFLSPFNITLVFFAVLYLFLHHYYVSFIKNSVSWVFSIEATLPRKTICAIWQVLNEQLCEDFSGNLEKRSKITWCLPWKTMCSSTAYSPRSI